MLTRLEGLGLGRPFDQVCVLVRDLDAAIDGYITLLGVGPWVGWRYDGAYLGYRTYGGASADWSMKVAVTTALTPQLELVQPERGPSVFEIMSDDAVGLHHVAYFVESFEAVSRHLEMNTGRLLQSGGGHGLDGDGRFGYFELAALGLLLEVIEPPARRADPHFRWP